MNCAQAYGQATAALIDGGADFILIETVFDTLNCKAAIFAVEGNFRRKGIRLPIMISGTITDLSGPHPDRANAGSVLVFGAPCANPLPSGLTVRWARNRCARILRNCHRVADTAVSAYPNAGLAQRLWRL